MAQNQMWRTLVDTDIPVARTAQDAAGKGLLTPDEAEGWIAADAFAERNFDTLLADFPGLSVAVAADPDAPGGIATFTGATDAEAIELARQFADAPWVLVSTAPIHADLAEFAEPALAGLLDAIGDVTGDDDLDFVGDVAEAGDAVNLAAGGTDGTIMLGNRPFCAGTFAVDKTSVAKIYLIDTGASISCISSANLAKLMKAGAKMKPAGSKKIKTAGGKSEVKFYQGKMSFKRDKADGSGTETATCDIPVAVVTADILGMDQLKKTGTTISFDPSNGDIRLRARPKPKPAKKPKGG